MPEKTANISPPSVELTSTSSQDKQKSPMVAKSSEPAFSISPFMVIGLICVLAVSIVGSYFIFKSGQIKNQLPVDSQDQVQVEVDEISSPSQKKESGPLPTGTSMESGSEIINQEMKTATKKMSGDEKYELWLAGNNFTATQLWVNVMANAEKILVLEVEREEKSQVDDYSLASPIWSPDGKQIAYLRAVIIEISEFDISDRVDLYIVNQDGSDDHLVQKDLKIARGQYGTTDLNWTEKGLTFTNVASASAGKQAVIKPI